MNGDSHLTQADQTAAQPNPDALAHGFEDHLFRMLVAANSQNDPTQKAKTYEIVKKSIVARTDVISAGQDLIKMMLAGAGAAFVLLIAFIYDQKAIDDTSVIAKSLVVISAISLLTAVFLTFGQLARFSVQLQVQKWRIVLAESQNWDLLAATWNDARMNKHARANFSAATSQALELLIMIVWGIGVASIIFAWVISFF